MTDHPVFLDHHGNPSDLGGKGKGLAWLEANGYRVPEWFGVSTLSLISDLGIDTQRPSIDTDQLKQLEFSPGFLQQLEERCRQLSSNYATPIIIRSSFAFEDGRQASFAGQFTSILDPKSFIAVQNALKECLKDLFSE